MRRRVIVVGDIMLDDYVYSNVTRIDQTAPVPVCNFVQRRSCLGGAANVANNLDAMGIDSVLVGAIGTHGERDHMIARMLIDKQTLATSHLLCNLAYLEKYMTTTKTRIVDTRGQMVVRFDEETTVPASCEAEIMRCLQTAMLHCEPAGFVISDYNKGVITSKLVQHIVDYATKHGIPTIIDPVPNHVDMYHGATLVTPNHIEAKLIAGATGDETPLALAMAVRERCQAASVLITYGADGAYLDSPVHNCSYQIPAKIVPTADTTGAGDTLVAGVAASLFSEPRELEVAARYGVAAATAAVQEHGTAVIPHYKVHRGYCTQPRDKIVSLKQIIRLIQSANKTALPVVTNGIFDLMHRGHQNLLDWAAGQGNFLVVLVNSDAATRQLKGRGRPVYSQEIRAEMVAYHPKVDAVCIFDELTPAKVLRAIGKCHLVKGPDYTLDDVIDREIVEQAGGVVSVMPKGSPLDTLSTSSAISKVKNGE